MKFEHKAEKAMFPSSFEDMSLEVGESCAASGDFDGG